MQALLNDPDGKDRTDQDRDDHTRDQQAHDERTDGQQANGNRASAEEPRMGWDRRSNSATTARADNTTH